MKVVLCQLNPVVGDIAGNTARVVRCLEETAGATPDLLVFPELFLMGYPPRDLLEHNWFIAQGLAALDTLCAESKRFAQTGILVGAALPHTERPGKGLHNSAVLIVNGEIVFHQNKSLLPSYDVFDETRYFDPAASIALVDFKGERLGITICEDAWNSDALWGGRHLYDRNPVSELAGMGASLLINISGSPFHMGKEQLRFQVMASHARKNRLPFVFVNEVGGNDELVFDGNSMYFDRTGALCAHLSAFEEQVLVIDTAQASAPIDQPQTDSIAGVHDALVLGVRDYLRKCGFTRVLLGLSGGIDSAVTAALAAAALGAANVCGVTMPSRYSSGGSVSDSKVLADNLGIEFKTIAIESVFLSLLQTLSEPFAGMRPDLAEENLQARIRGTLLMALSNKFGWLLLSTGNKSEMAVGYCTLYGDMNGGLSVISDLPKTMVYRLARYINREREIIPLATIDKPPSAELRPDQKDQDSLPEYEVLDAILEHLVEKGSSREQICQAGFDKDVVDWVIRAVRINEYKRRQAAPGLKVTPKAFGSGRRFPIAANYIRT